MSRRAAIGFDRKIDSEWLDAAAARVAAGASEKELRAYLWDVLDGAVSGDTSNSGRGKTVTVLSHIWARPPKRAVHIRNRALEHLSKSEPSQRHAIHWAMAIATYPFFADVVGAAGRLLKLQDAFTLTQLTRRLAEKWGDRSTMRRAAQRIVRSVIQWGALKDGSTRGSYTAARPVHVAGSLAELLVEGFLVDRGNPMALTQIVEQPAFFPFELAVSAHQLRKCDHFDIQRQGLDIDLVGLSEVADAVVSAAPTKKSKKPRKKGPSASKAELLLAHPLSDKPDSPIRGRPPCPAPSGRRQNQAPGGRGREPRQVGPPGGEVSPKRS